MATPFGRELSTWNLFLFVRGKEQRLTLGLSAYVRPAAPTASRVKIGSALWLKGLSNSRRFPSPSFSIPEKSSMCCPCCSLYSPLGNFFASRLGWGGIEGE